MRWVPPCGTYVRYIHGAVNLLTKNLERSIGRYSPVEWTDKKTPRTKDPVYFNTMTLAAPCNRKPYTHRASDN